MSWILRLCLLNIKRRRVRTMLTVLGVAIGVISVVSLLAVGMGAKKTLLGQFVTEDNVRRIEVFGTKSVSFKKNLLTKKMIENLGTLNHVENVYPLYCVNDVEIKIGKYEMYGDITGIPAEEFEKMNLADGTHLSSSKSKRQLVLGNSVNTLLFNSEGNSYWEAEHKSTSDLMGKKATVTFLDMNRVMSEGEDEYYIVDRWDVADVCADENLSKETEESYDEFEEEEIVYSEQSQKIYCNLDSLIYYLKKNAYQDKIIGQPLDDDDKPISDFVYTSAIVVVDDIEEVDAMVKKLQDMGFKTMNQKEYLDAAKKTTKTMQMFLGAIGMISLVVAVIGVSNTMTTAVYDRVSEIGVLKVLGCDLDELRIMFLIEAGILGALGGVLGMVCSLAIRGLLNQIGIAVLELKKNAQLVVMPWWLLIGAILFSALLGVLAGYFPARWASKLSPMEAIRK